MTLAREDVVILSGLLDEMLELPPERRAAWIRASCRKRPPTDGAHSPLQYSRPSPSGNTADPGAPGLSWGPLTCLTVGRACSAPRPL